MIKYLLAFFVISTNIFAFSYVITPIELNTNIEKKFPLEKKFLFSRFVFFNPELTIDKEDNLINFVCEAKSPSFVLEDGTVPTFKIFAKSDVKYNGKNIYLEDIKIDKIENKNLSPNIEKKLILATEFLFNIYFSKKPIYKLEDAGYALQTANTMIDDVIIDNGNIKILILE